MDLKNFCKSYCTGCGLCHSVENTRLLLNSKGFLVPDLENTQFQETYCPACSQNSEALCSSEHIWGDIKGSFLGWSADPVVREKASSGGILSELAAYLLDSKQVDGVIHIGVGGASPLDTKVYLSKNRDEVLSRVGSRYIQTSPLINIRSYLEHPGKYAFIGKPCDVMVLKNFLNRNDSYPGKIPFYLSFFCAGMPSLNANDLLLKKMGCEKEQVHSFSYRGNGWPGFATAKTENAELKMAYADAWGHILGRDKHKYCRLCMDGIGLFADVACADGWYIQNGKPSFSEGEGRNVVIARNETGMTLLHEAMDKGVIHLEDYQDFEKEMPIIQKYQYERRSTMSAQVAALKLFGKKPPRYKFTSLLKYRKFVSFKSLINVFWGTLKRIYSGRYN